MPWKAIADFPGCKPVTLSSSYPRLFVFRTSADDTGWLVPPYKEMTRFAADLRHDSALRDFLSSNRIRIGLRKTDVPPANIARQDRYGLGAPGQPRRFEAFAGVFLRRVDAEFAADGDFAGGGINGVFAERDSDHVEH
jgi:hypothetical protein